MLTFRMLWEMPQLMANFDKQKHSQADYEGSELGDRISTTPSGHDIHRKTKVMSPFVFGDPDRVRTTFTAVKDGKRHVEVRTGEHEDEHHVSSLSAFEFNSISAHDVYHHLVTHHGINLVSDDVQSMGGAKTWQRLSQKPGISMKLRHEDGTEHEPDHDWIRNYSTSDKNDFKLADARFVARKA